MGTVSDRVASRNPVISSVKDERVAPLRALGTRPGRLAARRCLMEGAALIGQVLTSGSRPESVFRAQAAQQPEDEELATRLRAAGVPVERVTDGVLRQVAGTPRPVRWLAVAELPAEADQETPWGDFALVCDGVTDPGNLGTLMRTARAMGIDDVVLTDSSTDVGSRRVLAASRGTALTGRVRRYGSPSAAMDGLHRAGFQVVATSPAGDQLQGLADLDGRPVALVVGSETAGVSDDVAARADLLVQIPMTGSIESLNVGVAAGISIYELRTRMMVAMLTDRIRDAVGRDLSLTARLVRDTLDHASQQAACLSGLQVIALMVVAVEQHTAADLRRDLGLGDDDLVDLLSPLAHRGWLERHDNTWAITAEGERAVAVLWPVQHQVEHQLLEGMTSSERETLRGLLDRIRQNAIAVLAEAPGPADHRRHPPRSQ